jgi:hypothetical protein
MIDGETHVLGPRACKLAPFLCEFTEPPQEATGIDKRGGRTSRSDHVAEEINIIINTEPRTT